MEIGLAFRIGSEEELPGVTALRDVMRVVSYCDMYNER